MLVVGAGPIGIELGQAFHRLGADVTIAQRSGRILTKEDTDVSEQMLRYLREEGITIRLNTNIAEVVNDEEGTRVTFSSSENGTAGGEETPKQKHSDSRFDKILIAAGRAPNIEGLALDKIGIQVGRSGIEVNNRLQTSVKNIYAAGDVIGHYLFTHVAAFQAQLLLRNIFFPFSKTINYAVVPWTTFCDPEVARCGLTEAEAREKYGDVDVFTLDQADVDRAVAEGETHGFSKVIASRWTGKILGVHLVGANAGEVIHEYIPGDARGDSVAKIERNDPCVPDVFKQCLACGGQMVLRKHTDSDVAEVGSVRLTEFIGDPVCSRAIHCPLLMYKKSHAYEPTVEFITDKNATTFQLLPMLL